MAAVAAVASREGVDLPAAHRIQGFAPVARRGARPQRGLSEVKVAREGGVAARAWLATQQEIGLAAVLQALPGLGQRIPERPAALRVTQVREGGVIKG